MVDSGTNSTLESEDSDISLSEFRARRNELFRRKADVLLSQAEGNVLEEEIHKYETAGKHGHLYTDANATWQKKKTTFRYYGGGFRVGNAELESSACIGVTNAFGCISISLEHRLSPEFKFPVAYENCWDALLWLSKNAPALGADLSKGFVVGGTSSGGHIANPLVHRARDEGLQPPITGVHLTVAPTLAPQALTEAYRDIYKSRDALRDGYTLI
ncbi:uncharacterized protein N7484_000792 [Penicillium longicatenatum]|uniref:uncharacterized protein n=1 Tax=Penicillium longicatenatum TaxID=1561947 RepID=UPI0025480A5D|nr:uncharacterized protein N7484_000792 [Penicillium longicatenatum]KAJ5657143.1 hypothetical protein N7484_000792 [Penicillium longicatenatum]